MSTDVVMPQMGESIFEGTITKWLKKPGDTVQRDEPLFEISTDKVDAEIPSPASGVLKEMKVQEGATVQVNTVVGVIDADGAGASAAAPAKAATPPSPSAPPPVAPPAAAAPAAPAPAAPAASGPGTEVVMPQMGESIFEGTITKWLKKVGDRSVVTSRCSKFRPTKSTPKFPRPPQVCSARSASPPDRPSA